MPLVEIIRGEHTSDDAIATVVSYASKLGKNPIVVNDCPGFLVNRVLFPYFSGFGLLMRDGADFEAIDKVMEKFGWPMGPAYLGDVIGLDTAVHCVDVLAEGYPDRMKPEFKDTTTILYENERYGQKNSVGYYSYQPDKRGRPTKTPDPVVWEMFADAVGPRQEFDARDVINRMMIPMCTETIRCLEDGIVGTATEVDMAMIYGIGFPMFRGGPLRYVDTVGISEFAALCEQYSHLGKVYEAPQMLQDMAASGQSFYA